MVRWSCRSSKQDIGLTSREVKVRQLITIRLSLGNLILLCEVLSICVKHRSTLVSKGYLEATDAMAILTLHGNLSEKAAKAVAKPGGGLSPYGKEKERRIKHLVEQGLTVREAYDQVFGVQEKPSNKS